VQSSWTSVPPLCEGREVVRSSGGVEKEFLKGIERKKWVVTGEHILRGDGNLKRERGSRWQRKGEAVKETGRKRCAASRLSSVDYLYCG